MPIFIARDCDGRIESIVLSKSKELALAYWQGQGSRITAVTTQEKNEDDLLDHPTGVIPLLKTRKTITDKYRIILKG